MSTTRRELFLAGLTCLGLKSPVAQQEARETIQETLDVLLQDGNWDYDEYMFGMTCGVILAKSILDNVDVDYPEEPAEWTSCNRYFDALQTVAREHGMLSSEVAELLRNSGSQ